jgi:hypothetical protein
MKLTVDMSSGKDWMKAAETLGDDKIERERTAVKIVRPWRGKLLEISRVNRNPT